MTSLSGHKRSWAGRTSLPGRFFLAAKDILRHFSRHRCMNLSAALSYYTIFSVGPFLVIVIAVASLAFGREAVTQSVFGQVEGLIGADGAQTIREVLEKTSRQQKSVWAAAIGFVFLFLGATGVFLQIQDAFNIIWEAKLRPQQKGWLKVLRNRLLSFGLVLGLGFLLIVSLALNAAVTAASRWITAYFPDLLGAFLQAIDVSLSVAVMTVLFAFIFKFLPDVKMRWRDVWLGGLFTSALFAAGRIVIGLYLARNQTVSAYGAAASVVLLILWINYSALILFLGAEFTACRTRSRPVK